MSAYDLLIIFIIIIKVIFILLKLTGIYNKVMGNTDTLFGTNILFWTDRIEFIYKFLMALLIIVLFKNAINEGFLCIYDKETLFLMYVFGFILLFTANWNQFISESTIITNIQKWLNIKKKEVKKTLVANNTDPIPSYMSW